MILLYHCLNVMLINYELLQLRQRFTPQGVSCIFFFLCTVLTLVSRICYLEYIQTTICLDLLGTLT